ncbi:hypothetical protein HOLleu_40854 [Holothuria leucospilota]|uniref:Uncharacterized protein n=1 Tax=Holothuria leucospilota TaxID=206669 RepID=A0A9Q0YET2_HOLLE|nr:hypothetical protein HOLleu_40854 [Holothuria leucospilota]
MVELMLGQVANYCPIIARNSISKGATSLSSIWQMIRLHYGFQTSGSHFLDLSEIKLEVDERYGDLYQRLCAFVEDSLLTPESNITHHGEMVAEEEEMTPTIENFIVLTWLKLINPELPKLVKQRYGPELRSRTLASLKPEISQALDSLVSEIDSNITAMRASATSDHPRSKGRPARSKTPVRPLCKEANRPFSHFLSQYKYLPEEDRQYLLKARQISDILDVDADGDDDSDRPRSSLVESSTEPISANRIQTGRSPYIDMFFSESAQFA